MRDHPTHETIDRFVRGELSTAEAAGVVAHFLRGCRFCEAAAVGMARLVFEEGEPEDLGDDGAVYEETIDRAFAAAGRAATACDEETLLVEEIYAALVVEGHSAINRAAHFRGVPLCLALMRRSYDLRHEDPVQMLRLAHFAVITARQLNVEQVGPIRVAELQARALGEYGNAQRITGDLARAEKTLAQALALVQEDKDQLLDAHLLSIQAALYGDQRRFPEAIEVLEKVEATYAALGDNHRLGRAVVQMGLHTGYAGQPDDAVYLLRRGLGLIDAVRDPELALVASHSLAWFLMEGGRLREARILLWENRQQYERHAGSILLLKRTWLEGQLAAGLGDLERAVKELSQAVRGFEEAELGYQAALATLDLGAVWLRQGRSHAALQILEYAAETFVAIGVGREALGALALLQQACEQERVDVTLIHQISAFFRRLEHDPSARFNQK